MRLGRSSGRGAGDWRTASRGPTCPSLTGATLRVGGAGTERPRVGGPRQGGQEHARARGDRRG
eukprot:3005564-Pyramimonas_sp.AAC.1